MQRVRLGSLPAQPRERTLRLGSLTSRGVAKAAASRRLFLPLKPYLLARSRRLLVHRPTERAALKREQSFSSGPKVFSTGLVHRSHSLPYPSHLARRHGVGGPAHGGIVRWRSGRWLLTLA